MQLSMVSLHFCDASSNQALPSLHKEMIDSQSLTSLNLKD
jgi:hypothetical protein